MKPELAKTIDHIHTPDSWARAVFQAALEAESAGKPLPGFSVAERPECVQVCVDTPFGRFCVCV